jgi:hypothetical protein
VAHPESGDIAQRRLSPTTRDVQHVEPGDPASEALGGIGGSSGSSGVHASKALMSLRHVTGCTVTSTMAPSRAPTAVAPSGTATRRHRRPGLIIRRPPFVAATSFRTCRCGVPVVIGERGFHRMFTLPRSSLTARPRARARRAAVDEQLAHLVAGELREPHVVSLWTLCNADGLARRGGHRVAGQSPTSGGGMEHQPGRASRRHACPPAPTTTLPRPWH